jgi:hypothetical protein
MSDVVRETVSMLHLVSMLFMAAPLYGLLVANERVRFAVPPGYNTDRYMENIIKKQPLRCYGYLAGILVTGLLLTIYRPPYAPDPVWTNWALIAKLVAFSLIVGLLSYVHFSIQPRIDSIINKLSPGEEVPAKDRPILLSWRRQRKRLSAICLFLVLTALIMGVTVMSDWSPFLVAFFVLIAALFAWRVHSSPLRFGWF